ncbi:Druantia anti-phage system protein DruA [Thiohalomonas denitrificans]|uniref:Uncharacterized protein n=1 Tax=Thiohalomonas denitrificans TaxID=415747 RepID=A0A1G5QT10_9GAMM|nr:Druantia anti-phage system protein DruA [Thiohalomonas denitrificans]SCZ64708.1 protein of unknown function [Thiohalomonas denitrificans]
MAHQLRSPKAISTASTTHSVAIHDELLRARLENAHVAFQQALFHQDKDYLRSIHAATKTVNPIIKFTNVFRLFQKHRQLFRNGEKISVAQIKPKLYLVENGRGKWHEIYQIVRSLWSLPYSRGYGRRLRFVVFDEHHEAVIGILGLQSPPADLSCRDELFSYPSQRKLELVNHTLDAHTVGAIPPYSHILGGKLVAGLLASDAVRRAYWRTYISKKTTINDRLISQPLVAITTTSAFGRSSIYNRLKYQNRLLAEPIGYTKGYGMVHFDDHYNDIKTWLESKGLLVPSGFGHGPKVRWQNTTIALRALGLPTELLRHGLAREVFLFRLTTSLERGMSGGAFGRPIALGMDDYSKFWTERWAVPRSKRMPNWSRFESVEWINSTLRNLADSVTG